MQHFNSAYTRVNKYAILYINYNSYLLEPIFFQMEKKQFLHFASVTILMNFDIILLKTTVVQVEESSSSHLYLFSSRKQCYFIF